MATFNKKMRCECGSEKFHDQRKLERTEGEWLDLTIRRLYRCAKCGKVFTTLEVIEAGIVASLMSPTPSETPGPITSDRPSKNEAAALTESSAAAA